jgi:hypothetical protein
MRTEETLVVRTHTHLLGSGCGGKGSVALAAVALCLAAGSARAVDKHWNAASGTWSTGANWSPSGVPLAADRALIGSTVAAQNDTVTLSANATVAQLHVTDGMVVRTNNSVLTVTGPTVISGSNLVNGNILHSSSIWVDNGPAAIDAVLDTTTVTTDGRIWIDEGAHLRCTGLLTLNGGHMYAGGSLSLTSNSGGAALRVDGNLQAAVEGLTINQLGTAAVDLDGIGGADNSLSVATARIDGSAFSWLTINGTNLVDPVDMSIGIGGGNALTMNLSDGWTMTSASELRIFGSQFNLPARINGGLLTFGGHTRFYSTNAHAQFNAPVNLTQKALFELTPDDRAEFNATATLDGPTFTLDTGATVDFDSTTLIHDISITTPSGSSVDGDVSFNGPTQYAGEIHGSGLVRQRGNASVTSASTVQMSYFDMDGPSENAAWSIGNSLTVNAVRIDTTQSFNGFDGTMNIGGGFAARLTVNILFQTNQSWTLFGDMTMTGDPNFFLTRLAGSRLMHSGSMTIGHRVNCDADLYFTFPATTHFSTPTSILRLTGESSVYDGASFSGGGTLHNTETGTMKLSNGSSTGSTAFINAGLMQVGFHPAQPGNAAVASLQCTPAARWHIELGGYGQSTQFDHLDVTLGTAQLAGDLEVSLIDLGGGIFNPQIGDTFEVLLARNGISGTFANNPVSFANNAFYAWNVLYGPTTVTLQLDSIRPLPCPADFNQDGGVDGIDVSAFFEAWEMGDPAADVNFDGGVDGIDVSAFFDVWEAGGC